MTKGGGGVVSFILINGEDEGMLMSNGLTFLTARLLLLDGSEVDAF